MTRVQVITKLVRFVAFGAFGATLSACEPKPAPPANVANVATPAPHATTAEQPMAVGDVIVQYRHFDTTEFVDGAKEDKVGTRWKVLFIDDDCVGIRLIEGRYKWVGDEPDKLPGYESKFCASDNYKRQFPGRPGKVQTFEEFHVVAP
ncbi:MAG: hypothetical protein IPQ07_34450 [Myxococcales bacterium]|nr:hypothetical protein [Myxococcales bacterium]